MDKSVIIVGGGLAGLTAGCYARFNGLKTTIFEMHTIPGGLCTAWKRKGYTFDISMHILTGSAPGPHTRMWQELGTMENTKFHFHDHYSKIEGIGKSLLFSTNRQHVEEQMLAISPSDAPLIKEFLNLAFGRDLLSAATLNPATLSGIADKLKVLPVILPLMKVFARYRNRTVQEFAGKFSDPFLREAVRYYADSPGWPMPDLPLIILAGFMVNSVIKAGVPLGGSQQVAFRVADNFKKTGGDIKYKSVVKDLIVEADQVKGVRLEDGSEYYADYVIWAADGHKLIFDILGGSYINETIRNMYEKWVPVKPLIHVMLGVNRDFSKEAHRLVFEIEKPVIIAGETRKWICMLHHCFDPSMAPSGKSAIEIWYDSDYDYWEKLSADREKYNAEKQMIADTTISILEKRYPGISSQIEVIDVPTPKTYNRYTGNWKGSPDGWYLSNDNLMKMEPLHTLPGIGGLYMAGQWTAPYTGTVIAALSGRQAIQLICKKEKQKFSVKYDR